MQKALCDNGPGLGLSSSTVAPWACAIVLTGARSFLPELPGGGQLMAGVGVQEQTPMAL